MEQRAGLPENIVYHDFLFRSNLRWVLLIALFGELLRKGIPATASAGVSLQRGAEKLIRS